MIDLPERFKNPTVGKIYYEDGKKFQTTRPCMIQTLVVGYDIETDYCKLTPDGLLIIAWKWAWDGASGGLDTKRTIRGSAGHDVFYKLMRQELLPRSERKNVDRSLRNTMLEDNAWVSRAWAWFKALSWFGKKNTHPDNKSRELVAP